MRSIWDVLKNDHDNRPVLAVVAGSGMVARCSAEAGADLLLALNAGVFRNHGVGTLAAFLPFGNANQQTDELLRLHLLPQPIRTPIIAGVYAAEPQTAVDESLRRWKEWGVQGVVNWPAVGFIDGNYRQCMEAAGAGMACEAAMLRRAKSLGFATFGFALSADEVRTILDAEVDGLILNLGLTQELQDVRERRDRIQQSVAQLNAMLDLVGSSKQKPLCLAFGGPVTTSDDLETLFRQARIRGFAGGSVFERLPVENAITCTIRRFRQSMTAIDHERQARGFGPMIGRCPAMQEVFELVRRVAPQNVNLCIEGETGTGKELVATQIHRLSRRSGHPLITLNCGAIPDSLLESELFGHEKGAFTSADRRRKGKFELAHQGMLFLDEIADLSPRGQVALLRAIQQREITPVGSDTTIPVDVRILTASNRPLQKEVAHGRFRQDLFYRLNQITIRVPPLRQRMDDLPLLVQEFLSRLRGEFESRLLDASPRFMDKLHQHWWPGNIRELEAVLREAAIREDGGSLDGRHFHPVPSLLPSAGLSDEKPQDSLNRRGAAEDAVRRFQGNKTEAAKSLGISRKTLYIWLCSTD